MKYNLFILLSYLVLTNSCCKLRIKPALLNVEFQNLTEEQLKHVEAGFKIDTLTIFSIEKNLAEANTIQFSFDKRINSTIKFVLNDTIVLDSLSDVNVNVIKEKNFGCGGTDFYGIKFYHKGVSYDFQYETSIKVD